MAISSINGAQAGSFSSGISVSPGMPPQPSSPQAGASQPVQPQLNAPGIDQVKKAADQINQVVQGLDKNLQFVVDQSSGKVLVQVVDTANKQVIRQIPSEETLAISKALDKLQGLLIRQQA